MPTVSTTLLPRVLGTLLLAPLLSAGIAASAKAAPAYKTICANAMCFHKNPHRYSDGKMYYFLTYRSRADITHFNLRFRQSNGEDAQVEIGARAGHNKSGGRYMVVRPGSKYTVAIQACNRGGFLEKSGCTGWHRITFYGPE
jgi:hypothetical protein